eukprot:TRINITY_DN3341_c0_g1_i11.p2 TRINITY_DN3341_c0_g1~~TRINITY_DN3341_c0_g1_i11.p2  ORF type:complete len:140 (+),score=5.31 TRINITY_DN3341_c0_g1_i11:37-420(+)
MRSIKRIYGARPFLLVISRSNRNITAEVHHHVEQRLLFNVSSKEPFIREQLSERPRMFSFTNTEVCGVIGRTVASRCKDLGIPAIHFVQRPGQRYQGRVKAIIDGVREGGLVFNYSTLAQQIKNERE